MLLPCNTCSSILRKTNDETNFAFGWYRDNLGNHTGFVCANCGTIHDCVGSLNFIAVFSGRQAFKVVRYFPIEKLRELVYAEAKEIGSGLLSEASVAQQLLGLPQEVVLKMVNAKFLDLWKNI